MARAARSRHRARSRVEDARFQWLDRRSLPFHSLHMPIDYEAEYDNRARVKEHPEILARIADAASAYRAQTTAEGRADFNLRYGPSPRQFVDIFFSDAGDEAPLAMFIHGGYWRSLEPHDVQRGRPRPERARRHRRARRLRPLPAGRDRRDHRADGERLPLPVEQVSQAHPRVRPLRRRASGRRAARGRLAQARRAGGPGPVRHVDLGPVRPRTDDRNLDERRLQARRSRSAPRLAAVLAAAGRPRARRRGRRRRVRANSCARAASSPSAGAAPASRHAMKRSRARTISP